MGKIDSFITGYLECTGPQVKGIHHFLSIPQCEFRFRELKNLLRILRIESQ